MRHGDAPRAAPRLRWGAAAAAGVKVLEKNLLRRPVKGGPARIGRKEMAAQRYRAGGPGVLRTPGRRPPHRNGGTFGSFSHERTTIIREVGKKMIAKPTRQLTNKATPAKANKEKMQRWRRSGAAGTPRKVPAPGYFWWLALTNQQPLYHTPGKLQPAGRRQKPAGRARRRQKNPAFCPDSTKI